MTKRNTILVFCTQKTPQHTWLSLQNAGVRQTPSVRVPVSQKERRCPRGKLLYCACSSRTWHTAAAFVYLSSEDHQQVITFLYLTEQNKTNELGAPEFGFEDNKTDGFVDLWVGVIKGVCRGGGERWFCDCSCNLQFLDELGNDDTTQSVRWISWNIWCQKSCLCVLSPKLDFQCRIF